MTDIHTLVPVAVPGWRVLVVTAYSAHGDTPAHTDVRIVPLIGWALVADLETGSHWEPAWWDDLGMTTGNPWQEIAHPLGPGEDPDPDHVEYLRSEAADMVRRKGTRGTDE